MESKKVNYITINTDASFLSENKGAGYAFYIISDVFKIRHADKFKSEIKDPLEAEIKAIGNAIYMLLKQKDVTANTIVINTDCKGAINRLEKRDCIVGQLLTQAEEQFKAKISLRWVKGHSSKQDARSYVNRWCDREAGKHSRK